MRTLKGLTVPPGTDWEELFTHFLSLDNHNIMPDEEWYNAVQERISAIGKDVYTEHVTGWFRSRIYEDQEAYKSRMDEYWNKGFGGSYATNIGGTLESNLHDTATTPAWVNEVFKLNYMYDRNVNPLYTQSGYYFYYTLGGRLLRGILHTAALFPDTELLLMADAFAFSNIDECLDVVHVYKSLPREMAMARILKLQGKVKKKALLKKIEAAITEIGKSVNMNSDQVKESMVSDFGLDAMHRILVNTGNYTVGIDLLHHKPSEIIWWENGQQLPKVPASAKKEAEADVKKLKAEAKKLAEQVTVHRNRIEGFYRLKRSWSFTEWRPLYIEHPFMGAIGKRLIWQFSKQDQQKVAIWTTEGYRTVAGEILDWLDESTTVELWHPVFADAAHVLQWRTYLTNQEIQQPFKQAFREVYLLTDAEKTTATYSNRFASHILNKDQFAALCKVKAWTPGDIENKGPNIRLPEWDLQAAYATAGIHLGVRSKVIGSAHVTTDTVTFLRKKKPVPLTEIPAIIFSEIMRDVDMFVGVTSLGNDPTWYDKGDNEGGRYWTSYAFGDLSVTAKIREEVLKNLVLRLPIAEKCRFEGKFLVVTGTFTTYKIHLGSSNILMAPNDRYLCIVQGAPAANSKVFLPFEGDITMSLIISKAMLLANDSKITDQTILSQIKRN